MPVRLRHGLLALLTMAALLGGCHKPHTPAPSSGAVANLSTPLAATSTLAPSPTQTQIAPTPTRASPTPTATSLFSASLPEKAPIAWLLANPMPARDEARLAREFLGREAPREADLCRAREANLGDSERFWVDASPDGLTAQLRPITATLVLVTEDLHVWLEEGSESPGLPEGLRRSAETFERGILPTNRRLFGLERDPALAPCPLTILNAYVPGAGGYFASSHLCSREINPYSSERPMFVVSLSSRQPGTDDYESALAHELQHMIHYHLDPNEEAWVNEGLSNLAEGFNGYPNGYAAARFAAQPNIALLSWGLDPDQIHAHYGGPELLARYLAQRYSIEALAELVREPQNGIAGWEATLRRFDSEMTFDAFYADWLISLALGTPYLANGDSAGEAQPPSLTCQPLAAYPALLEGELTPYGTACWSLGRGEGRDLSLALEGQPQASLVATEPASGEWVWWSNRGDRGHSGLEITLDLRQAPTATLAYDLWCDIEAGWDYAYLRASVDGGQTWDLLHTPSMVADDPVGHALGLGYTGASDGWVREEVPLDRYLGQRMQLRFDYVTDDALNRPGLLLDNLEVAAIGWQDDVEQGEGEWRAEGFLRVRPRLPQRYLLQVVARPGDGPPAVQRYWLDGEAQAEVVITPATGAMPTLVLLSAITPVTTEPATYRMRLEE